MQLEIIRRLARKTSKDGNSVKKDQPSEHGTEKNKARKVQEEEANEAMGFVGMGFVGMKRPRKMRGQKKTVPRK